MDKLKVLLVDDEAFFRQAIAVKVKEWGYDALEATNGRDALEVVKASSPDIVVLDYLMPHLDGIATLKEIRKLGLEIPVIAFTAHADIKIMKEMEKLKVSAFISKLSIFSDVEGALRTALDMLEKEMRRKK